jgi:hypothetical protein
VVESVALHAHPQHVEEDVAHEGNGPDVQVSVESFIIKQQFQFVEVFVNKSGENVSLFVPLDSK